MEMMMTAAATTLNLGAVSVGTAQTNGPSDNSSGSEFSNVLSDVRGSANQVQSKETSKTVDSTAAQAVQTQTVEQNTAVSSPEQSIEPESLADVIAELVQTLSNESGEEQDTVVKALLEILKKMQAQKNGETDEAVNIVMELLASMLGQNVQLLQPTAIGVTIPKTSDEIAQITSEQPDTSVNANADMNTNVSASVQLSENAVETGFVQLNQPSSENNDAVSGKTNTPEQTSDSVQPEQAEQTENPVPTVNNDDVQQLLNELLSQAQKELGLTKTEFSAKNNDFTETLSPDSTENLSEQPAQNEQSVQNEQSFDTFSLRINHRDSTQELNSIIHTDEQPDTNRTEISSEQPLTQFTALQPETAEIQPATEEHTVHAAPPEQQLAEEILSKAETLNGGRTEFTMELNPETLGKITVKLVSAHGRVEVSISAENEETGRLLQSRGENIGNTLRESGIELERYQVVSEREEAQLMQDSYDGSSKNPYGRDDEENSENQDDGEFLELLSQL